MRCERDGTGCGVREYRFPVGVLCFSERRRGALYSVSTRVVNVLSVREGVAELLGGFAVSVRVVRGRKPSIELHR